MPAPQPFTELPADEITQDELLECVDTQSPASVSATNGQLEATVTYVVPFNKERSAFRRLLGLATADAASPWRLRRELPAKHPRWPNLRCFAAASTPIAPKSNPDNDTKATHQTSQFDDELRYADYEQTLITAKFVSFGRAQFVPDDEMERNGYQEYWRYVTIQTEPAVETLQLTGANLKFAEGPPFTAGPSSGPLTFPCELPELVPSCKVRVRWMSVPHNYVSDHQVLLQPTKILNRLGTVNSSPFMLYADGSGNGVFPTHTVLLNGVTFEERMQPVVPLNPYIPLTTYDVTFDLLYAARLSSLGGSTYRGHRVFPVRTATSTIQGWYHATRTDGSEYLASSDLNQMFTHVSAP